MITLRKTAIFPSNSDNNINYFSKNMCNNLSNLIEQVTLSDNKQPIKSWKTKTKQLSVRLATNCFGTNNNNMGL